MKKITTRIQTRTASILGVLASVLTAAGLSYNSALAQATDLVPCTALGCTWCSVFELLQNVLDAAALLAAPIIIIFIMYGAILYIIGSAAGSDAQVSKARTIVSGAITGLVIVLLSFVIINALLLAITNQPIENFINIDCENLAVPEGTGPTTTP